MLTPFYSRDGISIFCGECSQIMAEVLQDSHIDLTVTSPPYDSLRDYHGYTFDFDAIAAQLWRVTKKGGVVVWVVGDQTINGSESGTSFRQALGFMELGFNLHDTMIYQTDKPPMNALRYQAEFEYMFVLSSGAPAIFNPIQVATRCAGLRSGQTFRMAGGSLKKAFHRKRTGSTKIKGCIWYYPTSGNSTTHPAIFPEALARDHIISWSNPDDLILDPMCGSGTVGKICVLTGRRFIGIEISEKYCELAVQRIRNAQSQPSFWSLPTEPTQIETEQQATMLLEGAVA